MADEEGEAPAEGEESPGGDETGGGGEKGKSDKKGKKQETWDEKVAKENQRKKNQYMPWGSDPCVKIRVKLGKLPEKDISAVKGSNFPWFETPRKAKDVMKDANKKEQKKNKQKASENEDRYEIIVKRNMETIQKLSDEVHRRRIFECNRKPGDTETYEEYRARKERSQKRNRKRKREDEEMAKEEEEESGKGQKKKIKKEEKKKKGEESEGGEEGEEEEGEEEGEEGEGEGEAEEGEKDKAGEKESTAEKEKEKEKVDKSGSKEKKEVKKKKDDWPGSYPSSITEDFITMLKMIIEAEFDTRPSESKKKKRAPKPSKKDKIMTEFTSFLNVLFTANEMMKKNDEVEESSSSPVKEINKPSDTNGAKQKGGDVEKELKSTNYAADGKEPEAPGETEAPAEENADEAAEE